MSERRGGVIPNEWKFVLLAFSVKCLTWILRAQTRVDLHILDCTLARQRSCSIQMSKSRYRCVYCRKVNDLEEGDHGCSGCGDRMCRGCIQAGHKPFELVQCKNVNLCLDCITKWSKLGCGCHAMDQMPPTYNTCRECKTSICEGCTFRFGCAFEGIVVHDDVRKYMNRCICETCRNWKVSTTCGIKHYTCNACADLALPICVECRTTCLLCKPPSRGDKTGKCDDCKRKPWNHCSECDQVAREDEDWSVFACHKCRTPLCPNCLHTIVNSTRGNICTRCLVSMIGKQEVERASCGHLREKRYLYECERCSAKCCFNRFPACSEGECNRQMWKCPGQMSVNLCCQDQKATLCPFCDDPSSESRVRCARHVIRCVTCRGVVSCTRCIDPGENYQCVRCTEATRSIFANSDLANDLQNMLYTALFSVPVPNPERQSALDAIQSALLIEYDDEYWRMIEEYSLDGYD